MRRAADGHDPVRTEERRERRQPIVRQVPALVGIGPDQPGRNAQLDRGGDVGQAAVPVAVVEQDSPGGLDVELDERLRLRFDVAIRPRRVGRGEAFDPRTDPVVRAEASRFRSFCILG